MYLHGLSDVTDDSWGSSILSNPADTGLVTADVPVAVPDASIPTLPDITPPQVYQDASGNYQTTASTVSSVPTASGDPTGGWTDLFKSALNVYGNIDVAKTKAAATPLLVNGRYPTYTTAGYSPFLAKPGQGSVLPNGMVQTSPGLSTTGIIGLAALGIGLAYLMKG